MFELMLWISGHALHHPRTLITYNRIAGKRVLLPFLLLTLLISLPVFASAATYTDSLSESSVRSSLLRHFDRWEGTPYRFGGNSRYGVDCSGFVHIIFRDALGIDVPRSTELLSRSGYRISYRKLVVGDILIFRTSGNNLHTGIFVGEGQFIHASKSRGVILSNFNNPYWTNTYEKSVRVIDRRI
jgi:cell wall-associated NlpC family hydrolase